MRSVLLASFLYLPSFALGFTVLGDHSSQTSVRLSVAAGKSDAVCTIGSVAAGEDCQIGRSLTRWRPKLLWMHAPQKGSPEREKTDTLIDGIFQNRNYGSNIVNQVAHCRMDTRTLLRIFERLDERVAHAEGGVIVVEKNRQRRV